MQSRLIKIFFGCSVCLYTFLVGFNNIVDYNSNFSFVSMVAKMDDTFSKDKNGWRSIDNPLLHHILFIIIIAWEMLISIFILLGIIKMIKNFKSSAPEFNNAKKYVTLGLSLGVLLWFTVFIAVGGEWF